MNLILVLKAHVTAHSTAPGAGLQDGLNDQATTTSRGGRAPFSARNGAPRHGEDQDFRANVGRSRHGAPVRVCQDRVDHLAMITPPPASATARR